MSKLLDQEARTTALTDLGRSFIVEAGAGSGKTSLMAGRVSSLLAAGVAPSSIAAISFTEMAASELQGRIVSFVERILDGRIPPDLRAAFPNGITPEQRRNLEAGLLDIAEITCTTIHGFCQRLLKPYPVEADIDPGARILDPISADLMFEDVFKSWMRDRLSETNASKSLLTRIVSHDPYGSVAMIRELAWLLRSHRDAEPEHVEGDVVACDDFIAAVRDFSAFLDGIPAPQDETAAIVAEFSALAQKWSQANGAAEHLRIVDIIAEPLSELLVKKSDGGFRAYRMKGKWQKIAGKGEGDRLNDVATANYERCCTALGELRRNSAARGLYLLVDEMRPLLDHYQQSKRNAALLDFDDLLISTRRLLRSYPGVTAELGARFPRILVDEFQDTDPVQTEIIRHLAFDPPANGGADDMSDWIPRPGAIFLVGDPKQAIYRFRGADVRTYLSTRNAMKALDPTCILEVGTNFRSCESVLGYVNARFAEPLSVPSQPGFGRLNHHRKDHGNGPCVAAIDIDQGETASQARDLEAKAVADLCSRLIGNYKVVDGVTGKKRPCEPGDIALLTPTGTELWRYEAAFEDAGLAVATQAGKSMLQRQEVQDLIALTRILADPRDHLAFGAFLRGPSVGLTEEEMLDISHALPAPEDGGLAYLNVDTDPREIGHEVAASIVSRLSTLRRKAHMTTPYDILSEAIEELQIRPILLARHDGAAERSLANVDRFLEMSRSYDVRGLRAFSDAMRLAWENDERFGEGRPDAEEQSISLITMHSAKGLEWPIVIPINALTEVMRPSRVIFDVSERRLAMPFFDIDPKGYLEARLSSNEEQHAERVRLWYVATTRARDLLIFPRHVKATEKAWVSIMNLGIADLPAIDASAFPAAQRGFAKELSNVQDSETFEAEHDRINDRRKRVVWISPSRHEAAATATSERLSYDEIIDAIPDHDPLITTKGSAQRGTVLHKLMEELVTGELKDDLGAFERRASELIHQIEPDPVKAVELELNPAEMAGCVRRTLEIEPIKHLMGALMPEVVICRSAEGGRDENVVYGFADAISYEDGYGSRVDAIVDWKSDVRPNIHTIQNYREQVRDYMKTVNAKRGLIVFMTSGEVVEVLPMAKKAA